MSQFLLLTDGGGLVNLTASPVADEEAVSTAAKRLLSMGLSGYVAEVHGPQSSDPQLTLVRAFGDPAATFQAARERLANRRRASGNIMRRVTR